MIKTEHSDEIQVIPQKQIEENIVSMNDEEWETRILCNDGNCIGIIGPDGRCRECGKPYQEDIEPQSSATSTHDTEERNISAASVSAAPGIGEPSRQDENSNDWESRVLCSDGNCIGVIGPDGRCKECGKPLEQR